MRIGSFDIGIKNIGFAVFNSATRSVEHLEIIDLCKTGGRRVPFGDKNAVSLVRALVRKRRALLASCDVVAIEKQMIRKMIIIQFVLEAVLSEVTTPMQVHARSVKVFFKIGTGKHRTNKKAAIKKTYEILDERGHAVINKFKKKDDVCDAILQAIFVAHKNDPV